MPSISQIGPLRKREQVDTVCVTGAIIGLLLLSHIVTTIVAHRVISRQWETIPLLHHRIKTFKCDSTKLFPNHCGFYAYLVFIVLLKAAMSSLKCNYDVVKSTLVAYRGHKQKDHFSHCNNAMGTTRYN